MLSLKDFKLGFSQTKIEILSGLTVALALIPESVAFAFVAHVDPLVSLYAAFFVCLITACFGGRPGMISGSTGALAVVMVSLVVQHGTQYLFAAIILMGLIQLAAGIFKLGKFIRIVPHPVMLGFVNGLAIVIFLSQLNQFKVADSAGSMTWLSGIELYIMLGLVALTMVIIYVLPKFTKAFPAPLAAILVVFGFTQILGIDTRSVGDMASIAGVFPSISMPDVPFSWDTLRIILPYSVTLAGVGLIESLLTLNLIDEITDTKGKNSQECLAQGGANIVTGFFGGMGGCAMIGQSMINITSGARNRLSGIVAGLFLISFILYGSVLIEKIPLAALTGVMFMVVIGTFAWSSLRVMNKIPRTDAFVIVLVSVVTVWQDLAIAVFVGVVASALSYAWKSAKHITTTISIGSNGHPKTYNLHGPLFFGSIGEFKLLFDPKKDPDSVVVNFEGSRVWDYSALEALETLSKKYKEQGKTVQYKHLSKDCAILLAKMGNAIIQDPENDPVYEVVMDR